MNRSILAFLAMALPLETGVMLPASAHPQTISAQVVPTCGAASYSAGFPFAATQDPNGRLCSNGSGSAGGGTAATASTPISITTATTTQLVAALANNPILITSIDLIANGADNVTVEYGTGTNCGTGTTALTGAYPLTAQSGLAKGAGIGALLFVPAGNALCILTTGAVQLSGSLSYATVPGASSSVSATASAAVTMSSATTTRFITGVSGKTTYVTSFDLIAGGLTSATIVAGTGTNCGTGSVSLTGAYPFSAQAGLTKGDGVGAVLFAPVGDDVCVTNSASVQLSGSLSYAQQ